MAIANEPISQSPMQNVAHNRAECVCNLSPSDQSLGRDVKALRQRLLDFGPIALHWPIVVSEDLRDLDANPRSIIGFEERFQERLAHFLADFRDRISSRNSHV